MSAGLMSEPKKGKKKPGPRPDPDRARMSTTMVRSRADWKLWVDEFKDFVRSESVADLIDRALVSYAREMKFPKLPPKR